MTTLESRHEESGRTQEAAEKKAVELSQALEKSEDNEFIKNKLSELFELLEKDLGIHLLRGNEEISRIYKIFQLEQCLFRVERLTKILETLELNKSFIVGKSENDSHYPNAVISEPEGFRLAFSEGQVSGSLKVAIGLDKSSQIKIFDADFSPDDLRDIKERTYLCRHIEGEITKDDIRGVIMRISRNAVDDTLLTEKELENKSLFIFRGFIL